MFLCDVKPIKRVEQRKLVTLRQQETAPSPAMTVSDAIGLTASATITLGRNRFPVATEQNVALGAFDIDFQEVDGADVVALA